MARGQPLRDSDIDIAVLFSEAPDDAYERMILELAIQAALEDACGLRKIDLRSINTAPILVLGPIVQEGYLLYNRDKKTRVDFEVLTRKNTLIIYPRRKKYNGPF